MLAGKYSKYINRCTTVCPRCSHELILSNIIQTPLLSLKEVAGSPSRSFYGGNVVRFSETKCNHCDAEILLFLKSINNGFKIHDVAIADGAIDNEFELKDNVIEEVELLDEPEEEASIAESFPISPSVDTHTNIEQGEIGPVEINIKHAKDIMEGIKTCDLELALGAVDNIHFGYLPKTLVAAGMPKVLVYTDKGRMKKRDEYVTLITNYIAEAEEAIAEAATELDNEMTDTKEA